MDLPALLPESDFLPIPNRTNGCSIITPYGAKAQCNQALERNHVNGGHIDMKVQPMGKTTATSVHETHHGIGAPTVRQNVAEAFIKDVVSPTVQTQHTQQAGTQPVLVPIRVLLALVDRVLTVDGSVPGPSCLYVLYDCNATSILFNS